MKTKKRKRRKPKTVMCNRRALSFAQSLRTTMSRRVLAIALASSNPPLARPFNNDEQKDPRKSYALIVGTVWGPDDRPVYGVKVKIRRADQKKAKWELILQSHRGVRPAAAGGQGDLRRLGRH